MSRPLAHSPPTPAAQGSSSDEEQLQASPLRSTSFPGCSFVLLRHKLYWFLENFPGGHLSESSVTRKKNGFILQSDLIDYFSGQRTLVGEIAFTQNLKTLFHFILTCIIAGRLDDAFMSDSSSGLPSHLWKLLRMCTAFLKQSKTWHLFCYHFYRFAHAHNLSVSVLHIESSLASLLTSLPSPWLLLFGWLTFETNFKFHFSHFPPHLTLL